MNRRYLFARLPHFPTERFLKAQQEAISVPKPWWVEQADDGGSRLKADVPLVLVDHGPKGTRISASSPEAMGLGLSPEMKLADARTMVPIMRVEQHNKNADDEIHRQLARWMMRWSPAVARYGGDGFLLDTTGCDHLAGGEARLAGDIVRRFKCLGFSARVALANTPAAAIALVDHGAEAIHIQPEHYQSNLLDGLPVEALRLDDDTVLLLKRLGLKCIGDVRPIPRTALERRFRQKQARKRKAATIAQSVQMRLDQLSGILAEPLDYIDTPQPFRATLQCPDLALEQSAVGVALDGLLERLCEMLEDMAQGGRVFRLTAYRADSGSSSTEVRLSQPVRSPPMIARLFHERLDQIDCGYGIDLFVLEAGDIEPLNARQSDFMKSDGNGQGCASLITFADTVTNRAGMQTVHCIVPRTSHVPERAQRMVPVSDRLNPTQNGVGLPIFSTRPLRLLPRPEPAKVTAELPDSPPVQFLWRRVLRKVIRSRGPERVLPEWWHDNLKRKPSATFRDYYDVEDERGLRYWIFRSIKEVPIDNSAPEPADNEKNDEPQTVRTVEWFVHGLF